ncbi:class I SAM-dependent methyltransferase [Ancylomarina euxinus]|uniref:Class I SAM-dependent methyltransferase n=1 Tax=Ancylomarina euxinus TaxID=2283627 RepID=A0A425Y1W0_9BACT|nr:class I SAM-dependent methyltransferase [Ancylomarina euxinus]MCZ4695016.1 class I SAM-dependent methyltransferase [Ancylomarina euxinus]MUP15048.1 methyltransferase domain-containing protein [Ancylomarina euxinus]RRG21935.1 class I SAM-dependent methyltransferase [Ancylomarina euxinus]
MTNQFENNAIRGPINSWLLKVMSTYMHYKFGDIKNAMFKDHPQTVVEIGSGTGENMRYLRKGTHLIAIEPNVHMHESLEKAAEKYGIHLEIRSLIGEAIDLDDESCEFVVSTLVLCTVKDLEECLQQIKRILKPSGKFVFIEHVKARENSVLGMIQNLIHKPWHWCFEGCHTNRDIQPYIESAGFSDLRVETYNLYSPIVPIIPQIRGVAIK